MNISYEYQIAVLDVENSDGIADVVSAIHYRVVAKSSEVDMQPVHSGVVELDAPSVDNFTEFSSLTKEQVEQWLKAKIDVLAIENELALQLEHMATQPIAVVTTSKLPAWQ